jgi:hypothetical protein
MAVLFQRWAAADEEAARDRSSSTALDVWWQSQAKRCRSCTTDAFAHSRSRLTRVHPSAIRLTSTQIWSRLAAPHPRRIRRHLDPVADAQDLSNLAPRVRALVMKPIASAPAATRLRAQHRRAGRTGSVQIGDCLDLAQHYRLPPKSIPIGVPRVTPCHVEANDRDRTCGITSVRTACPSKYSTSSPCTRTSMSNTTRLTHAPTHRQRFDALHQQRLRLLERPAARHSQHASASARPPRTHRNTTTWPRSTAKSRADHKSISRSSISPLPSGFSVGWAASHVRQSACVCVSAWAPSTSPASTVPRHA